MKYKIIAWNVNGIRSLMKNHDIEKYLNKHKPHIFCVGETKLTHPDLVERSKHKEQISGYKYRTYNTSITKKGYSGTTIWSKKKPINVFKGINYKKHDDEGRVITYEFKEFYLVHVYTPNSGQVLERLDYRTNEWDPAFWKFIAKLEKAKPVVVCGDLNCARYEIDIHSPKTNLKTAGFTIEERNSFNKYIDKLKLVDAFRHKNPDTKDAYTFWSYRGGARKKNKGWRIDYFLTSKKLEKNIKDCTIHTEQNGSDHAPIELILSI